MRIECRFFAAVREAVGTHRDTILVDPAQAGRLTVGSVRELLRQRGKNWDEALGRSGLRMAVNQQMCDEAEPVSDGNEVAFFPPVTGG